MSRNRCLTPPSMPAIVMPRVPVEAPVPYIVEEMGSKKSFEMFVSTTEGDKTVAPPAR